MPKALPKTMPRTAPAPRALPRAVPSTVPRDDNTFAYFTAAAVILLVLGFVFVWFLQARAERFSPEKPDLNYASIGPLVLSYQGYSFSTKLAVRTDSGDAGWAEKNKHAMEIVLQNTLAQSDPKEILGTNNIGRLQTALKDDINKAFQTSKVREVILTDFVFASDE